MTSLGEVVVGVVMAVGLVGVVVPVIPGLLLIAGAAVLWALEVGGWQAWVVVGAMVVVMGAGTIVKYRVPGRELADQELSARTWVLVTALAVLGFFVVPLVGLVAGGLLGLYAGQRLDLGARRPAWAGTKRVLAGVGKGIAIEFCAGFVALSWWVVAVVFWV